MTEFFMLTSDGTLKIKSVTSTSRGGRAIVKIELEVTDIGELGYALERLNSVQLAQEPSQPQKTRPKRLALPPPQDFP